MFTLPLQIFYFHQVYTWFIIANLLVVPFAGLILATVVAVLLLAAVPHLGGAAVWLLQTELGFAERLTAWVGTLPCAVLDNLYCDPIMLLLLYAALALFTLFLHSRLRWALPAACGALLAAVVHLTLINPHDAPQGPTAMLTRGESTSTERLDSGHSPLARGTTADPYYCLKS